MDDKQKYYKWIVFLFLLSPSIACSFSHFWKVLCYKLNEKKIKNKTKFCKLLCTLGLDYFFIFFIYSKWKYFECIYNSWKQKKKNDENETENVDKKRLQSCYVMREFLCKTYKQSFETEVQRMSCFSSIVYTLPQCQLK